MRKPNQVEFELELGNIISSEFGAIRQVCFNKLFNVLLIETIYGFQFIYEEGIIIKNNISQQYKIIINTFENSHISIITRTGLYRISIQDFLDNIKSEYFFWEECEQKSCFLGTLNFPFFQYFSGQIKSIRDSEKIILVEDNLGVICYNVLSKKIEFKYNFQSKLSNYGYDEFINHNERWSSSIGRFEVSEDEKYFYISNWFSINWIFIFRINNFSLLYEDTSTDSLPSGVFYDDKFIQVYSNSKDDYWRNSQIFIKIINLLNGNVTKVSDESLLSSEFYYCSRFENLLITLKRSFNQDYVNTNKQEFVLIDINEIIATNKIVYINNQIHPVFDINHNNIINFHFEEDLFILLRNSGKINIFFINDNRVKHREILITSIYEILEDYRFNTLTDEGRMTTGRIKTWINQFDNSLRLPILSEVLNVFKKRYYSKNKVIDFLDQLIDNLTRDFKYNNPVEFLKNSIFLNPRPKASDQAIMLFLLDNLIKSKYGIGLKECGKYSNKYTIYLDDILCDGLTLISDIKEWSKQKFSINKTYSQAVSDNSTILVLAYIFIHKKNYTKILEEMKNTISVDISLKHKLYKVVEIENDFSMYSKFDLVLPVEAGQMDIVTEYKIQITSQVDQIAIDMGWENSPDEFYRPAEIPMREDFFTSSENRKIVENEILKKGIEILKYSNSNIYNLRALGSSLPEVKDFGFGALCFTWTNIPKYAPLVFWLSGCGFMPLFKVIRSGDSEYLHFFRPIVGDREV